MPYPPYPKMYNPFLVSEPTYTAQQQTAYPEMTNSNYMQMYDESLMNNYDRMNPDKSFYTDPTSSPQIKTREYNQPNALQQRLSNYSNIVKGITDAPTNNGIEVPIVDPNTVNSEPLTYDPLTGLPIQNQQQSTNPYLGIEELAGMEKDLGANLDFVPYANDVEYIRSLRKPEYEINLKPYVDSFGTFVPPVVSESIPAAPKQMNYMAKIDSEMIPSKDFAAQNVQTPEPDPYKSNEPEITLDVPSTDNYLTQTPKNKFGTPEAYYLGKSMLDATALINNMVQPQPPSIQMKNTYLERQRLNPEPYDTMRSQMRDQGTQAYRMQRENISQASDLMKGLAAVTSGTQQGLMQVGMQQAAAEQQIQGINQQISAQEQAGIAQTQNQEALTNYQNQAQAQQYKDQMVSAQLNRLGDTAGAYSDYVVKKELAQKMTDLSKDQADKGNAIQIAMLKYQAGQNELGSDAFKEAQRQSINNYINETKTNLLNDPRYSSLGPNYDPLTIDQRENKFRTLEQRVGILYDSHDGFSQDSKPIEPVRSADMDDIKWNTVQADFKRRQWGWENDKAIYDQYKQELDKAKPILELERKFNTELRNSYDVSGKRQDFQSNWFKERGLKSMQEVISEVETLVNTNRQIFK